MNSLLFYLPSNDLSILRLSDLVNFETFSIENYLKEVLDEGKVAGEGGVGVVEVKNTGCVLESTLLSVGRKWGRSRP